MFAIGMLALTSGPAVAGSQPSGARADHDKDGLNGLAESRSGTDPRKVDSDGDGVDDADEDRDRDRVDNGNEARERTRPDRRDSDRDGRKDGKEDADRDGLNNTGEDQAGNDPIDSDSDDDGLEDGDENAGVIVSFKANVLTIKLFAGGTLRGLVVDETDLYCDGEAGYEEEGDDEEEVESEASASESDEEYVEYPDGEECGLDDLVPRAIVHSAEVDSLPEGTAFSGIDLVTSD
jgi:hypothetical protein